MKVRVSDIYVIHKETNPNCLDYRLATVKALVFAKRHRFQLLLWDHQSVLDQVISEKAHWEYSPKEQKVNCKNVCSVLLEKRKEFTCICGCQDCEVGQSFQICFKEVHTKLDFLKLVWREGPVISRRGFTQKFYKYHWKTDYNYYYYIFIFSKVYKCQQVSLEVPS